MATVQELAKTLPNLLPHSTDTPEQKRDKLVQVYKLIPDLISAISYVDYIHKEFAICRLMYAVSPDGDLESSALFMDKQKAHEFGEKWHGAEYIIKRLRVADCPEKEGV